MVAAQILLWDNTTTYADHNLVFMLEMGIANQRRS